jgi:hypothetical protein
MKKSEILKLLAEFREQIEDIKAVLKAKYPGAIEQAGTSQQASMSRKIQ